MVIAAKIFCLWASINSYFVLDALLAFMDRQGFDWLRALRIVHVGPWEWLMLMSFSGAAVLGLSMIRRFNVITLAMALTFIGLVALTRRTLSCWVDGNVEVFEMMRMDPTFSASHCLYYALMNAVMMIFKLSYGLAFYLALYRLLSRLCLRLSSRLVLD